LPVRLRVGDDDLVINGVAECLGKCAVDNIERLAAIVSLEILDVFKDERGRAVEVEDFGDREPEIPLLFIFKAMFTAEAQFF